MPPGIDVFAFYFELNNNTKIIIMTKWKNEKNQLNKVFSFKNFSDAISFVNKVAELAEDNNHHPDILLFSYKNVRLTLTTHTAGKVTEKDINLAELIDKI